MPGPKIEDFRFSSSLVEDFITPQPKPAPKTASVAPQRIRVASVHQLAGFQLIAEDQLIRLSQKDFWKLGKDEKGHYIERLVDDEAGPVKD